MALADRSDFKAWLEGFERQHALLHGRGVEPLPGACEGCGEPLVQRPSATSFCLVCLAEQYGRDRSRTAGRIAAALRVALAEDGGETPASDIREAVEEILDEHERGRG